MTEAITNYGRTIDVTDDDVQRGAIDAQCPACEGTGEFTIHDDVSQECVPCKGTGEVSVSL